MQRRLGIPLSLLSIARTRLDWAVICAGLYCSLALASLEEVSLIASSSTLFFFFLVCGVWNLWPNEWWVIVNFLFFTFFSGKFCSWVLIFLTNKKLIIVILPIILFYYKNFGLKFEKQIRGLLFLFLLNLQFLSSF